MDFFLRLLPETFIYICGINIVSRKYFGIIKNVILSVILSIFIFCVRLLPIFLGLHMIISIVLTISILAIAGIPIIKSIYSTLLLYFIHSLGDVINLRLIYLLNINTSIKFSNPFMKCLLYAPSLIILMLFVIAFYYLLKQREEISNIIN